MPMAHMHPHAHAQDVGHLQHMVDVMVPDLDMRKRKHPTNDPLASAVVSDPHEQHKVFDPVSLGLSDDDNNKGELNDDDTDDDDDDNDDDEDEDGYEPPPVKLSKVDGKYRSMYPSVPLPSLAFCLSHALILSDLIASAPRLRVYCLCCCLCM